MFQWLSIILLLFLMGCSKNATVPEEPAVEEFRVFVQDMNGSPYSCGFIQLTCEEISASAILCMGNQEMFPMRALNNFGECRSIFPENSSVTIRNYQVLDYLFEEVAGKELDLSVSPGSAQTDSIYLDRQERVNVYWERPDFSQNHKLTGRKILTIVGDDYDFMECQMITRYLAYYGAEMVVASNRRDICSHYWLRIGEEYQSFPGPDSVTCLLQNMDFQDFDCLFCPGGNGPENLLREYPEITSRIYQAWQTDSVFISAICHGPLLLAASDIIDGRRVTGFPQIQSSLIQAGGIYLPGEPVVLDGNIQTGNWPRFNTFANCMAEILDNW